MVVLYEKSCLWYANVQGASVITIPAEDGDEGIDDDIIFSFNSS